MLASRILARAASKTIATTDGDHLVGLPAATVAWIAVWEAPAGGDLLVPIVLPASVSR